MPINQTIPKQPDDITSFLQKIIDGEADISDPEFSPKLETLYPICQANTEMAALWLKAVNAYTRAVTSALQYVLNKFEKSGESPVKGQHLSSSPLSESNMTEVQISALYDELVVLCKAGLAWAKKHGYPEVEDYPQYQRAREIGALLHNHAGLPAMQKAVHIVYEKVKSKDGGQAALLEYGWGGIGNWQA